VFLWKKAELCIYTRTNTKKQKERKKNKTDTVMKTIEMELLEEMEEST